ncbi:MAG TPA: TolC family protein [Acidobacteriaceae bacterium]|nr:TolC family protein [Acidobacteriaceae bacterium]
MQRPKKPVFRRSSALMLGGVLALAAPVGTALAQSAELPSNPTPNRSSLSNPYYGSVTLTPETDGVLKLSLDDAVTRGFAANLGLKENEAAELKFKGQEMQAAQYLLPSITVTGGTGYNEYNLAAFGFTNGFLGKVAASGVFPPNAFSGLSFITKADVTTGQINYEQTLFSGTYIDGYKAARAAEKSAYFSKMSGRGEVVQQVATAYLAVIAARSEVENAKALLDADKVLFDQAHAKHEAGTVANLDELRPRVQYQQQKQTVLADENALEKDEILLKREIGVAPGQKIELTDPNPYSELASRTPEDLKTEAYANRQDYQNLQAQEVEARMTVGARRAERLPTLSFKGNYGVTGVSGVGYHGTLMAVGTLKVPIFREASLRGDTEVAKAQLLGVTQQLGDLRGHIDQQVRSSLLDVQAAQQLVEVARSNVELAKQALSDETDRFHAGVDDTLPLVQAQSTLQSAQSNLVQSLYQFNVSKLGLARSTGVLEQQYKAYLGR